jgi:TrmH family RNA methyltransferase
VPEVVYVQSKDNPQLKRLRRLLQDPLAYRKDLMCWVEGEHLCQSALENSWLPQYAIFSESYWQTAGAQWSHRAFKNMVVPDALFKSVSALESVQSFGFVLQLPDPSKAFDRNAASVVLDRVQDAGNVGSILRSAAAFGFKQVLALKGTAALWSHKVVRAGMGAHFGLTLHEGLTLDEVKSLQVPIVCTSPHQGLPLHRITLPAPCAWVMSHEGQGVDPELLACAQLQAKIEQVGWQESLNVAAAAAICFYSSAITAP